ncbi:MAG: glycosyl transferase [Bacteroidetes bacterium]|nr:glycosyl transferase [Bacteroidota bacterium]
MTVAPMRTIDRFLGIPLCWLTGVWLTITKSLRKRESRDRIQTVLVIKFFGLGSIVLSTPFLTQLRRHNCKITFLTFETNRELVERLTQPDKLLTISTASPLRFMRDTLSALRLIRSFRPDAVFDLEFFSKFSTAVSAFSGAPVRVGFELPTFWRRVNVTHQIPIVHTMHVKDLFLEQLKPLGLFSAEPAPIVALKSTHDERGSMERKLGLGSNNATVISMNINAGPTSIERRWPPDRFMNVASALRERYSDGRFFLIGSDDEHDYVQAAIDGSPPGLKMCAVNCAGLLSLGELIALFERSSLLLTNDSGPMHIASAVGTPVIALFGPESPRFYGPVENARVVYKAISCSPCMNVYNAKLFVCPYNARCMHEISVNEVLGEVERLMVQPQARGALAE